MKGTRVKCGIGRNPSGVWHRWELEWSVAKVGTRVECGKGRNQSKVWQR